MNVQTITTEASYILPLYEITRADVSSCGPADYCDGTSCVP